MSIECFHRPVTLHHMSTHGLCQISGLLHYSIQLGSLYAVCLLGLAPFINNTPALWICLQLFFPKPAAFWVSLGITESLWALLLFISLFNAAREKKCLTDFKIYCIPVSRYLKENSWQCCQCLVLYVKTLVMLPKKGQATSSLVSGLKKQFFFLPGQMPHSTQPIAVW